jgi:hypothetical protein
VLTQRPSIEGYTITSSTDTSYKTTTRVISSLLMRIIASATWQNLKPRAPISTLRGALSRSGGQPRYAFSARCNSTLSSVAPTPASGQEGTRSNLFSQTYDSDGKNIKPFYITTPIFYVNACMSPYRLELIYSSTCRTFTYPRPKRCCRKVFTFEIS